MWLGASLAPIFLSHGGQAGDVSPKPRCREADVELQQELGSVNVGEFLHPRPTYRVLRLKPMHVDILQEPFCFVTRTVTFLKVR